MAIYDGFFDAVEDESGQYDRTYDAGDFTGYFGQIVGSGVCIYENPDSLLVTVEDGVAVIAPGYLFIQGYWLKNDADYFLDLTDAGVYAILAHLNTGTRRIDILAQEKATPEVYPNSLVLAYVTVSSTGGASAVDTRYNTSICGVIDSMGGVNDRVAWAIHYIDTEIETKLAQAEASINAQSAALEAKIAEVEREVEKLAPPPVGTIKFSASRDVGAEWLRCDGSFVSERQYPELVEALGKLTPSGDKFQVLSRGEIGTQISNGALYGGKMWVYSYATGKLYGVDVDGSAPVKEITLTSDDVHFGNFTTPTTAKPIALSVVPHKGGPGAKLFLAQNIGGTSPANADDYEWLQAILLFCAEFAGDEESLQLAPPFARVSSSFKVNNYRCVPYVVSGMVDGIEKYSMLCDVSSDANGSGIMYMRWANEGTGSLYWSANRQYSVIGGYQRVAFGHKSLGEVVAILINNDGYGNYYTYEIGSFPSSTFASGPSTQDYGIPIEPVRSSYGPMNIVGASKLIWSLSTTEISTGSITSIGRANGVKFGIDLPSAARVFVDGGAYLWGKDVYVIFVGTGILFSRTLNANDFGYLDTTDVLGTITQFGYLDYSQDENTLYILGQDTTNRVVVAKMELNTLFDYANDGAWLPMIASDGVPAYIKAREPT